MLPMFADIKSLEGKMKRKRFGQRVFVRVENRPRMDDLRLVITCACLSGLAFARIPVRYRLSGSPVLPENQVIGGFPGSPQPRRGSESRDGCEMG